MLSPDRILECVAEKCTIGIQDITGLSRVQNIREARFFYCLITRELTRMPYQLIGNYINRSHCSVLHGIRRAYELIDIYPEMETLYKEIKNEVSME